MFFYIIAFDTLKFKVKYEPKFKFSSYSEWEIDIEAKLFVILQENKRKTISKKGFHIFIAEFEH